MSIPESEQYCLLDDRLRPLIMMIIMWAGPELLITHRGPGLKTYAHACLFQGTALEVCFTADCTPFASLGFIFCLHFPRLDTVLILVGRGEWNLLFDWQWESNRVQGVKGRQLTASSVDTTSDLKSEEKNLSHPHFYEWQPNHCGVV